jgi:glycine hydroxymethyltransferase
MAAKSLALKKALEPSYREYQQHVVRNSAALAESLKRAGATLLTGGTDNHLVLLDVRPYGLSGRQAESALRSAGVTLNRNVIPNDPNGAWYTSGLRLGTPALTTLGMGTAESVDGQVQSPRRCTRPCGRRRPRAATAVPALPWHRAVVSTAATACSQ